MGWRDWFGITARQTAKTAKTFESPVIAQAKILDGIRSAQKRTANEPPQSAPVKKTRPTTAGKTTLHHPPAAQDHPPSPPPDSPSILPIIATVVALDVLTTHHRAAAAPTAEPETFTGGGGDMGGGGASIPFDPPTDFNSSPGMSDISAALKPNGTSGRTKIRALRLMR